MDEIRARAELLALCEMRAAKRKASEEAKAVPKDAEATGGLKDMDVDVESSSSEDTSDEAFLRTHTVEEERERAKYEGQLRVYETRAIFVRSWHSRHGQQCGLCRT